MLLDACNLIILFLWSKFSYVIEIMSADLKKPPFNRHGRLINEQGIKKRIADTDAKLIELVLKCMGSPDCAIVFTCMGNPDCAIVFTCMGSPDCAIVFTCMGSPD